MRAAATAAALITATGPAAASEGWSFRLTPQLWAPSFDAQVDIAGRRAAETDVGVFDELEGVGSVEAEVRRGAFALTGEWTDLDVGEDATAGGGRIPATIDLDGTLATVFASWRVAARERWSVEALAGGRYVALDAEVTVPPGRRASTRQTWGEPLVGVAGDVALTDRLTLAGRANVGGFGVGSDLTWEARGRLAFRLSDHVALAAGYRHVDVEYEEEDVTIDVALTGPFLALDLAF
jgi:hypothetical protein